MNKVKYNPFSSFKPVGLDQFFNEVSGRSISDFFENDFIKIVPSVNIIENEDSYVIEVAAPGLAKDDFSVEIDDQHLVIEGLKKENKKESVESGKTTRREFNYGSFKRRFHLSDDIDKNEIIADYSNGILSINVKKKEESKIVKKTIKIS